MVKSSALAFRRTRLQQYAINLCADRRGSLVAHFVERLRAMKNRLSTARRTAQVPLVSLLLLSGFLPLTASAANYYVDASCPSSGNGTSTVCGSTGPWKSLGNINCTGLTGGDVINLRAGTYGVSGSASYAVWTVPNNCKGVLGNPLVIQNYAGEAVEINGLQDIVGSAWTQRATGVYECTGAATACGRNGSNNLYPFIAWYDSGAGERVLFMKQKLSAACDATLPSGYMYWISDGTTSAHLCVHLQGDVAPSSASYLKVVSGAVRAIDMGGQPGVNYVTFRKNPAGGSFKVGKTQAHGFAFWPNNVGITIDGLDIGYGNDRCINMAAGSAYQASSTVIQNNVVHDCGQEGIRIDTTDGALVYNNKVYNVQNFPEWDLCQADGYCLAGFSDSSAPIRAQLTTNAIIRGNEIYNSGGAMIAQSTAIDCENGCAGMLIENNYIHDMVTGVLATSRYGYGIFWQPFATGDNSSSTVRNNRLYNVDVCFAMVVSSGTPGGTITMDNNTCVDFRVAGFRDVYPGSFTGTLTNRNNIFAVTAYTPTGYLWESGSNIAAPTYTNFYCPGCGSTVAKWGAASYTAATVAMSLGANNQYGDPNVDKTNGVPPSLRIMSATGSAYGKGKVLSPGFPDFEGEARPGTGVWDIGADQFSTGLPPPTNVRAVQ